MNKPTRPALASRPQRGFTLVELMMVLVLMALLLAGAWPAMHRLQAQHAVRGAAAQFETDVQFTRNHALMLQTPLRLAVQVLAADRTCYMVHSGAAGSCRCQADAAPVCEPGSQALRWERQAPERRLWIANGARSLLFHPVHGTVTPTASVEFAHRDGPRLRQVINILGRTRSCSPNGLPGWPPCV